MAMLGENRSEAVWRVVGLILYSIPAILVGSVFTILIVGWMVIDVLWQFVTDEAGMTAGGSYVIAVWDHIFGNLEWILFGRGRWQWPSV